ncbi:AraC family transcriptional regulator [Roseivivax halodurans JCM 10272]|uniref:AraC family transcriptional regulator n=1 Tax=Roseivivax halodurans JCM 10272 TaxID=1449350 RepID=X7EN50_9RHOB|nr:AraC family transcriptional regulator [Roseivivax halodurans JCM 10272]
MRCQPFVQVTGGEPWRMERLHDRNDDLLLWVTRGQGRIVINGVRRGLGTNNAVFLPAGTLMSVELGSQGFAQVIQAPKGLTDRLPSEPLHLRPRDAMAQAELTAEIEAMQREIRGGRAFVQDALAAHLTLVAVWLERQKTDGIVDAPRETEAERLVRRYSRLLVEHFRSNLMLADYAQMLDVTPTHLTRTAKAACGLTASEMLMDRVIHEARSRLTDPEPPIGEVAEALGFNSAAYFSRFIEAHTGAAPSALRARATGRAPQTSAVAGRRA